MNSVLTEQEAFAAALACTTPAGRAACLDAHCGTDAALRRRVEALLQAATQAGDFLESPPAGPAWQSAAVPPAGEIRISAKRGQEEILDNILDEMGGRNGDLCIS